MGLTKQYLRYIPAGNFNIIANNKCNIQYVILGAQEGRYLAAGAQEHVIIWDFRLADKAQVLVGEKTQVTRLCASTNKRHLVAGYSDGTIQIYDLKSAEVITVFAGHRSEITTLSYDVFGHKLASGSLDTDVVVWDTVTESGICRLSGHKGPITETIFMANHNVLISSSKDSYVKFWDLDTQHCFRTLIGHHSEVWSLSLMKDDLYLVTACGDMELRVWKLFWKTDEDVKSENPSITLDLSGTTEDDPNYPLQCIKVGSLLRTGRGRVSTMVSDNTGQILACHGSDKQLELFYFCTEDQANMRMKKRIKKEKKKANDNEPEINTTELSLRDCVKRLSSIKLSDKPKSLSLVLGHGGELRVAVSLATNALQMYNVLNIFESGGREQNLLRSIFAHGHRTDARAVAFSHDSLAMVSGSAESVKLWNRPSQACLCTIETGPILCLCFAPGDRHVLAGLENGQLLILDIASGDVLETIPAHTDQLWSLFIQPNLNGCISGGGDNTVKFWQFELVHEQKDEKKTGIKVLSLLHTGTLKLEHSVLCVRITPNSKFIACALLDSTIKIFFMDTLKFYLSLYGHKMPVLCMDISSDSNLIATGSSDHNIRIWGLDFGDCRKSIFAHDGPVTGLQFVPQTHYIFSCGKDGTVKMWDGDAHVKIMSMQSHMFEARNLAVSPNGKYVVSCGMDKVLRLSEKSEQVLVLGDEEEEEREEQEARQVASETTVVPGQPGLNLASRRTIGSERAADNILECLDVCKTYESQVLDKSLTQLPALMMAYKVNSPEDLMLEIIQRIRASDLEEALLLIPFSSACEILLMLPKLLTRSENTELICRLLVFLLRVHHASLVGTKTLLPVIQKLQKLAILKINQARDTVGYNLHGMQFIQNEIEIAENVQLFRDATIAKSRKDKSRKQREKMKRSVIMLS